MVLLWTEERVRSRRRADSRRVFASFRQVGTVAGISNDLDTMQVGRADFMLALDEVHAAFGVSEAELQQVVQNGIIHFDARVDVSPFSLSSSLCELGAELSPSSPLSRS